MKIDTFQAELVAIAETGERDRIVGAVMAGDDRTPLGSSAWRNVVLPVLQGDSARSKLSTVTDADAKRLLGAFRDWVKAVSKPGKTAMGHDAAAVSEANAAFKALDGVVGKATPSKPKAASKPRPKPASEPRPAASKPRPAASKPKPAASKPKPAASKPKPASRPKPAASKPKPKPKPKPASRPKPAASKPRAASRPRAGKGAYRVRLDLTFEEI